MIQNQPNLSNSQVYHHVRFCLVKDCHLLSIILKSFLLLSSFIYVALRIYLIKHKTYTIMKDHYPFPSKRKKERHIYLGFYTCTNSINVPVSSVIVIQMNLPKSKTRLPLPSSIKEAMVDCHSDAPISYMSRICSNEHCLVMLSEVTSGGTEIAEKTTSKLH